MSQLGLFGDEPDQGSDRDPAPVSDDVPVGPVNGGGSLAQLGQKLPPNVKLGTSSWSFPGWHGLVYDRHTDKKTLARHGLSAYAQHPLFRAVGLDRTYYGPLGVDVFERYADAVPDDFRFLVKGHEWLTRTHYPRHPRYGGRRGESNPHFLDPSYATDEVVGPAIEGLGDKLGTLLFQFSPGSVPRNMVPEAFVDRLSAFLQALPDAPVSVELRDPRPLTRRYRDALLEHGSAHCLNAISGMPRIGEQWKLTSRSNGPVIIRWMLHRRHDYQGAKQRFAPFDTLAAPDPETRSEIARAIELAGQREVIVIVNNKAEGCSPLSVQELAQAVVQTA